MRTRTGAVSLAAVGLAVAVIGLTPERAASVDGACDVTRLAGTWRNVAPVEGSDVVAASIRIECNYHGDARPKVEIALKVRCLRYECAWQAVPAAWVGEGTEQLGLTAAYREERVERAISVEAPRRDRLRLSVTTRFLKVPLEPRRAVYELERVDD
jgi:hypothetical protein